MVSSRALSQVHSTLAFASSCQMRRYLISNSCTLCGPSGLVWTGPRSQSGGFMKKFIPAVLLAASFIQLAPADVLLIDGPDNSEGPGGWYSLLGEYLSQSWTQSTALQNVSISAAV